MSSTSPAAEDHRLRCLHQLFDRGYRLARALEAFLESFHRIKTPGIALRPLSVCVDGSEFSMASMQRKAAEGSGRQRKAAGKFTAERLRELELLLEEHLASSKYLVVLCAGPEYESSWRDFELACGSETETTRRSSSP